MFDDLTLTVGQREILAQLAQAFHAANIEMERMGREAYRRQRNADNTLRATCDAVSALSYRHDSIVEQLQKR